MARVEKEYYSIAELSIYSGVSERTLRAMIKDGDLKAVIIGKSVRVKRSDFDAILESYAPGKCAKK